MIQQLFNALCSMIINLFSLFNRGIKGTDNLMDSYCTITQVAQVNADRILDEAKAINQLRKAEQETKITAKFEQEAAVWQAPPAPTHDI